MPCHCQVHQGSKCSYLVWDVNNKTQRACVDAGVYAKSLHHPSYFDMSLNCSQNVCKRASILKTKVQYTHLCTHIYTCPIKKASLFDGCQKCSRTLTAHLLWRHDLSIGKKKSGGVINRVPVRKARKSLRDSHLIPDNGGKTSPGIQPESSQV